MQRSHATLPLRIYSPIQPDIWNIFEGIEFKDFILGFCQCAFLCTTLTCIEIVYKIWYSVHRI